MDARETFFTVPDCEAARAVASHRGSLRCLDTKLPGVLIVFPDVHSDSRGFFLESYNRARYRDDLGIDVNFVQDNHSRSKQGVLRGLHLQRRQPQGKLVRVVRGTIWDVAVDIDPGSPTFREWVGVELSAANHRQLYIPPGYAHGFCALSKQADVLYKCTAFRLAGDEYGIAWDDPELAIDWPVEKPLLSDKDAANPSLREYLDEHGK